MELEDERASNKILKKQAEMMMAELELVGEQLSK